MMVDLALLIYQHPHYHRIYQHPNNHRRRQRRNHLGAELELIFVSLAVTAATKEGKALNVSDIERQLSIPRTNIDRHLKVLAKVGRIRRVGSSYLADLNAFDEFLTPDRLDRVRRIVTETARKVSKKS